MGTIEHGPTKNYGLIRIVRLKIDEIKAHSAVQGKHLKAMVMVVTDYNYSWLKAG